MKLRKSSIKI